MSKVHLKGIKFIFLSQIKKISCNFLRKGVTLFNK
ncbi:hypothetical protein CLOLEP_01665 [[Clostridium] leptum DSM 753]|uniref:Uncharacterized protein n=1 Tax=[Clostridium] leptum DSM 753 TaxID=428125 RepID=A7VSX4_9FIRM|nr:hypothetical protein CLOLEP_01665 [[Clostridium] leptum DSM 753]